MTTTYTEFLATKKRHHNAVGLSCTPEDVHPLLHDWQREIVAWAVRTGRCALWADTGLGKTIQQVEWLRIITEHTAGQGLIIAPLAVCQQTIREAAKVDVPVTYVRNENEAEQAPSRILITNYERATGLDPDRYAAVVLDEASILKQSDGRTRTALIDHFAHVPRRLTCTATPAPNDPEELTNQAEYLGVCSRTEMLATYFVHDKKGWRLKGHARRPMFAWMSSWAIALRSPADLGYDNTGYILPGLDVQTHLLPVDLEQEGQLFATDLGGVGSRARVRRNTLEARCQRAAELVRSEPDEPWLLWTGLNDEADILTKLIPGAVNVRGSQSPEEKANSLLGFADGKIRVLVTKGSIAAFGLNFQRCAHMVFVGLSDSWEGYYQAIRRCYRYGQTRVVNVHIVLSELEGQIATNVARKEREATAITAGLVEEIRTAREGATA